MNDVIEEIKRRVDEHEKVKFNIHKSFYVTKECRADIKFLSNYSINNFLFDI